jgi:hypothetical protein
MKQKIIIGLSVVLLVSAVILIGHDLFRKSPVSVSSCCGDENTYLKKIDTTRIGYYRTRVLESQLKDLSGIAVAENQIFLCGNREVAVFDTTGNRIGGFHTDSASSCITIFDKIVYVAAGARITGYDFSGNIKVTLKPVNNNSYITSVAANDEFIFVADAVNKKIFKYTPNGTLVLEIGQKDSITGAPGFIIPSACFDVSLGGFDDIWVVNPGRREIENYTLSGQMRSSWGNLPTEDNGFTGCCNPAQMALLPDGSFVTYEKGVDKIKLFDATGRFKCFVAGAGSFRGKSDFQLGNNHLVKDLATDTKGNIYILDAYNRINIFKPIV